MSLFCARFGVSLIGQNWCTLLFHNLNKNSETTIFFRNASWWWKRKNTNFLYWAHWWFLVQNMVLFEKRKTWCFKYHYFLQVFEVYTLDLLTLSFIFWHSGVDVFLWCFLFLVVQKIKFVCSGCCFMLFFGLFGFIFIFCLFVFSCFGFFGLSLRWGGPVGPRPSLWIFSFCFFVFCVLFVLSFFSCLPETQTQLFPPKKWHFFVFSYFLSFCFSVIFVFFLSWFFLFFLSAFLWLLFSFLSLLLYFLVVFFDVCWNNANITSKTKNSNKKKQK